MAGRFLGHGMIDGPVGSCRDDQEVIGHDSRVERPEEGRDPAFRGEALQLRRQRGGVDRHPGPGRQQQADLAGRDLAAADHEARLSGETGEEGQVIHRPGAAPAGRCGS